MYDEFNVHKYNHMFVMCVGQEKESMIDDIYMTYLILTLVYVIWALRVEPDGSCA